MMQHTFRSYPEMYETSDGRKYVTCNSCDEVIDLTPDGQFTFNTLVYGNGYAVKAYCSLECVDRMIRPALTAQREAGRGRCDDCDWGLCEADTCPSCGRCDCGANPHDHPNGCADLMVTRVFADVITNNPNMR